MRVFAVSVSDIKGVPKRNVDGALLRENHGIVEDAHAGPWHRQVSLLALESIERMRRGGEEPSPGDLAENITTQGVDLSSLPVGSRLRLGNGTVLEITQKGKECHGRCAIFERIGDCVMPREGVFCKVVRGGFVRPGDRIEILDREDAGES